MNRFLSVSLVFLALGGLAACGDDGGDSSPGGAAGSGQTVEAKLSVIQTEVFDKSCSFSSCHGANATAPELTAGKSRGNLVDRGSKEPPQDNLTAPGRGEAEKAPLQAVRASSRSAEDPNFEASKKLVVAGKPDESMLYLVLKGSVGSVEQMPQGLGKIDAAKIEAVRQWIADGAQDN